MAKPCAEAYKFRCRDSTARHRSQERLCGRQRQGLSTGDHGLGRRVCSPTPSEHQTIQTVWDVPVTYWLLTAYSGDLALSMLVIPQLG
ncbi:hypothetical protein BAUCODRAFT_407171 [Baudoinia panamericana UAMH 10762]|uniref:Uncharacterized protein n=1 Tax=Baudoinia panamericana (strain UAMH 10762) TaxID=717646 RepID=M2LTP5_BAUPA|nr:uncharacterized protein BAUCODRAFT_407171 [Baudoinia panamericana UAMH 10762]EMC97907.1 hypothetical protein BAUCODRAFT_407171 [Baudoinia panamericana UAMH 10762]